MRGEEPRVAGLQDDLLVPLRLQHGEVGRGDDARMVSLGVLGRSPGISAFRLTAAPTMFEVTREPASGSTAPGGAVVLRGEVA